MLLRELTAVLDSIAPLRYAEPWDNVGLLAGDPAQTVSGVLLTIDYTAAVAAEARDAGCDAVIAYHPPLFSAVKRITGDGSTALLHDAIRRGVALYSPHTALDVADGGTNDLLADLVGLGVDRRPLRPHAAAATEYKLVTFVPADAVDIVSQALFAAGAGHIGNYAACSFRGPGTGTFFGQAGTIPTVGVAGRMESADELRVETVVPIGKVEPVLRALRETHPYEEPAFDLVVLAAPPSSRGIGRLGPVAEVTAVEVVERVKRGLEVSHVLFAGDPARPVRTVAMCAGAGGDLLGEAIAAGADLYLTGELRHHDALRAVAAGMAVICTLHSNSERAVLRRLADRLGREAPGPAYQVSRADRDPFAIR
jgi:dinuclear metal center YbgI/SA1388 family protein